MRSICILPYALLMSSIASGCFKDEGGVSTAGDASASTSSSTSLEPTNSGPTGSGPTSGPTSDTRGSSETWATSSDTDTSSGTTGATTSDGNTSEASTTTGEPPSECSNGVVEGIEECDNGEENADVALCTTSCMKAKCFDGLVQSILGEECDLGVLNSNSGACLENCKKATCGDGHTFFGVEECDNGDKNQADLYGGCTPMTCTLGPHCGDDDVQKPFEECDLGQKNGGPGEICSDTCSFNGNVIFVTSKSYSGQIAGGGITAADDQCNTLAMEAGLANAGAFRAWISDGNASPSTWNPPPAGPFILLDTTVIAESWADLTDGSIGAPIDVQENGAPIDVAPFYAWTGTTPQGMSILPEKDCAKWTIGTKEAKGAWGRLASTDGSWSNHSVTECQSPARLICIEK